LYFFSGLLGKAVVTPVTPTKTWDWVWKPDPGCSDIFQTYTIDKGCGNSVSEFGYGSFLTGGMHATIDEVTVTGSITGSPLNDAATLPTTPAPQPLPTVPLDPDCIDVRIGDDGTTWTKLLACAEWTWALGNRRRAAFFLNCSTTSFDQTVELDFPNTYQLVM